jgi:hypothetical protein
VSAPALRETAARHTGESGIGALATAAVTVVLLAFAISVDFPRASQGFKGDEATYYSLTHSLARDRDFAFQRRDLIRVWEEYPSGPEGIFLKKGKVVHGVKLTGRVPFVALDQSPDPSQVRLFYGKSYIYPLVAAPFVAVFCSACASPPATAFSSRAARRTASPRRSSRSSCSPRSCRSISCGSRRSSSTSRWSSTPCSCARTSTSRRS